MATTSGMTYHRLKILNAFSNVDPVVAEAYWAYNGNTQIRS